MKRDTEFTAAINRTICTPELVARLKAVTARTGAPQSFLVRQAVEEFLERKETE